jgi:hypothetical protein
MKGFPGRVGTAPATDPRRRGTCRSLLGAGESLPKMDGSFSCPTIRAAARSTTMTATIGEEKISRPGIGLPQTNLAARHQHGASLDKG